MVTRSLLITLFVTSVPVFADTLLSGAVYFDSQQTLEEVIDLSAEKDNESILKLIENGHVSQKIDSNKDIVILTNGLTPESPAEFRFLSQPSSYWTLTKFVTKEELVEPTPTPTPERSRTLTAQRPRLESENNDPSDDDNGRRIWHRVNGKWKWYPADRIPVKKAFRKPVRKALPLDEARLAHYWLNRLRPRGLNKGPATP
jgi:hypothetical protein